MKKNEIELHKWIGIIERNPKAWKYKGDFIINNVPKDIWKDLVEKMPYLEEVLFSEEKTAETIRQVYLKIRDIVSDYLDMPEEHKTVIALWIIGTYSHEQFETFPYLFFNAMRGSGKTRILKLITSLAKNGQLMTSLTEAVLFRTVGTLGIDEFESLASKEKQALRELLNASYKKGVKIVRMKRKKTMEGDQQVAEEFEPYRPIVMANIWGIEEVLSDRCISLILEKSECSYFTKLIEDFSQKEEVKWIVRTLSAIQCSLCSVVSPRNVLTTWNQYVRSTYQNINTLTTLTAQNNTNYTKNDLILTQEEEEFCKAIDDTGLNGRHLELYFPLFLIAKEVGEDVFDETLAIAKKTIAERKIDEVAESKDVLIYKLVSNESPEKYYKIQELTSIFRIMMGEGESDWLNSKWVGRALKRLNLITNKKRMGDGIQVMLNVGKAKKKMELFK